MTDQTDSQLLKTYVERRLESAFSELVRRHVDFVYSAAIRMVRDPHLAEDVTQGVFIALAGQAPNLLERAALGGWLHLTAQNIACQTVRTIERRRTREQEAAAMNELFSSSSDVSWEQIEPHLDAALGELTDADRDAVVLRYFENKSAVEMADILGLTDEAAQKRVSRAVEKLREFFSKRKITIGAGGLGVLITANAVQAAPVGLITAISTTVAAGAAVTTSTVIATATKTIAMTTLQKTFVTAAVAVLAGASIYEAKQARAARAEAQKFQEQQAVLAGQNQQLQNNFADATNQLAGLLAENSSLRSNPHEAELLKLRGEATRLRNEVDAANDPVVKKALRWKANVEKMKLLFAEHPEQQVPEMKLLSDDYFFDLARDQDLESSNGVRQAYSEIRMRAKNTFAYPLQQALAKFINANDQRLPATVADLKAYFETPVDDAMLDQYTMLYTGTMSEVKDNFVLRDKQVIDPDYDDFWQVGPNAYGPDSSGRDVEGVKATMNALQSAIKAFSDSNGGNLPTSLDQLKPFVTTAEQQTAYDAAIKAGVGFGRPK